MEYLGDAFARAFFEMFFTPILDFFNALPDWLDSILGGLLWLFLNLT